MTNNRTQLEKFAAKMAKKEKDAEVIAEESLKNRNLKKQGEKIAEQNGLSTEEVFMLITREGSGAFVKMWNNSMEEIVRDTMRTEIRTIIQEEMAAAYRGIIRGLNEEKPVVDVDALFKEFGSSMSSSDETIPTDQQNHSDDFLQEEVCIEPMPKRTFKLNEQTIETKSEKKANGRPPRSQIEFNESLKQAIIEAHYADAKPIIGSTFKKMSSRNNGLYQTFMKQHKGIKGAWSENVISIIKELESEAW